MSDLYLVLERGPVKGNFIVKTSWLRFNSACVERYYAPHLTIYPWRALLHLMMCVQVHIPVATICQSSAVVV